MGSYRIQLSQDFANLPDELTILRLKCQNKKLVNQGQIQDSLKSKPLFNCKLLHYDLPDELAIRSKLFWGRSWIGPTGLLRVHLHLSESYIARDGLIENTSEPGFPRGVDTYS